MTPRELARQVRRLEIITRKAVNESLAGEYRSVFKGQGIEFETVRDYQPGDDVRSIDWNVTARMGHPFVKQFVEERELTVMLVVDVSASGDFGSTGSLKSELAAHLCALLVFSATRNLDKVGLILFTDGVERVIPPFKGPSQAYRIIRDLLEFQPKRVRTRLVSGIECLGRVVTRRCVAFLVSDFQDTGFERPLRVVSQRHDLIAVTVTDPREIRMPDVGLIELADLESGVTTELDSRSPRIRQEYEQSASARRSRLREVFRSSGIDQLDISPDQNLEHELLRFFRKRAARRSR